MENFAEELKKYFENTPKEKILEDWAKSAKCDNIGITVDEFLNNTQDMINLKKKKKLK